MKWLLSCRKQLKHEELTFNLFSSIRLKVTVNGCNLPQGP